MLVLTRRSNQKVVFPNVGITVEVLRIKGNIVKLGIEAPNDVKIVRDEIQTLPSFEAPDLKQIRHDLRNRLNTAKIGLHLLNKQLEAGMYDGIEKTLQKLFEEFEKLELAMTKFSGQTVSASISASAPRRNLKTLLVEDDSNEMELLAGFLRMCGFEVSTAIDGAHALEYLSTHEKPDMVLLDMMMPRCNGPETLREIRCNPKLQDLKIFAVSGTSPMDLGIDVGPSGIDYWFAKPINPENLVKKISQDFLPA